MARGKPHISIADVNNRGIQKTFLWVEETSRPSGRCPPSMPKGCKRNSLDSSWGQVTGIVERVPA